MRLAAPLVLLCAANAVAAEDAPKTEPRTVLFGSLDVGSSGFLTNGMLGFQANRDLSLNAVNWLSSDEDLISIRPKEAEDRRLNVNQRQMNLFFYFDLIAIPLLIIMGGVSIFVKRR